MRTGGARTRALRLRLLLLVALPAGYCLLAGLGAPAPLTAGAGGSGAGSGRRLLDSGAAEAEAQGGEDNCTAPAAAEFPADWLSGAERRRGWAAVHALVAAYLFLLLALVCDEYLVPSIKIMCARLGLPEDVAGATFMAAATSSPELFINGVGTFITEGDIGVGTVVGSGVFNILAVPACCGLFAGKVVRLPAWPLTRECLAYGATVLLLIGALSDGQVEWFEALAFVLLYALYVGSLCLGPRVAAALRRLCCPDGTRPGEGSRLLLARDPEKAESEWQNQMANNGDKLSLPDLDGFDDEGVCSLPEGASFAAFCWWLSTRPLKLLLALTVPDCRKRSWRPYYPLTFFMCMLWIAVASYVVAWMITVVGDTLRIPDSVMGLTLLAAGTSLPEAVSSVIVTNQGHGAMGISNSIASNTFNILLCLGLPWLLKSVFLPPGPGQYWVNINSGGLLYNTISLLTTICLLYAAFAWNSFQLNRKVGAVTLLMYLAFLAFAFAVELNVFGVVNLPTCPH